MEGCRHLTSHKKHKEKYSKIVGCKKRLACTVCGSNFNVHTCLTCERMFCFSDHLTHGRVRGEQTGDGNGRVQGEQTGDGNNGRVRDEKTNGVDAEQRITSSTGVENGTERDRKDESVRLSAVDDVKMGDDGRERARSDEENVEMEGLGEKNAAEAVNTGNNTGEHAKTVGKRGSSGPDNSKRTRMASTCILFVNKRYGCVYCLECRRYLFFTKLLEIFINIKYRIKNQKNYSRMHCSYSKGIINLGNTCYISSVLQVFFNTGAIKKCFFDTAHEKVLCRGERCIVCALKNMYMECYSHHGLIVPNEFLHILWSISSMNYSSRQFDAHEFFLDLCELLHKHFFVNSGIGRIRGDENTASECTCVIHRVFCGVLNSTLTCTKCSSKSVKEEKFYSVSIGIHNQKSVNDALVHFFTEESLGETILCQRCEQKEPFLKEMSVVRQPPILVLHLKRFQMNKNDPVKDNSVLEFTHLVECRTLKNGASRAYRLFGMVCHVGTLEYGHYFTFLRIENRWKRFDDERITDVDENEMCDCSPYILFYELE